MPWNQWQCEGHCLGKVKVICVNNDFCQLSRSLPVFVGFPPKIIGKKIHLRIHRLTLPCILYALSGQLGPWKPFIHFCFIHLENRDRAALPGGGRLHFCLLAFSAGPWLHLFFLEKGLPSLKGFFNFSTSSSSAQGKYYFKTLFSVSL